MIEVQAGDTFEPVVDNAPTGLTGTIGVKLTDLAGATVTARSTAGITEINPGEYVKVSMTAPATPGDYIIVWDTGGATPVYASENLTVEAVPANSRTATDVLPITDRRGNVLVGKNIFVYERDSTTRATVYDGPTSGTVVAQPLTTDDDGYVVVPGSLEAGWVDFGLYDVVAAGYWRKVHWDAGSPIFTSPIGPAGGDLGGSFPNPTIAPGAVDYDDLSGDLLDRLEVPGVFNVLYLEKYGLTSLKRDHLGGLTGTDNTAALQALVNYIANTWTVANKAGAVIYFPPGGYRIDGPVNFPIGQQAFVVRGAGRGGTRTQNDSNNQKVVQLRRCAGTSEMFTGSIDSVNVDHNPALEFAGLDFDGGKDFGIVHANPICRLPIMPEFRMRDCKFQSNDGLGLAIAAALNADMSGVRFHNCGSAWVDPLDNWGAAGFTRSPAFSLSYTALAGTNTIRLTDMEFEANLGIDALLLGSGSSNTANIVLMENWKMEGFGDGGAYNYLYLVNAYQVEASNLSIIQHRPAPAIYQDGGHAGDGSNFPLTVNHFTNLHVHTESSVSPYAIDHVGGGMFLDQAAFSAAPGFLPSSRWIHVRNTVDPAGFHADNASWDDGVQLVQDDR